jgi:hypothetical protein
MIKSSSGTTHVGNQTINKNILDQSAEEKEREKPAEFAIAYLATIINSYHFRCSLN